MQTHRLAHWLISRLSKGDKKKVRKLLYHSLRTNMAAGEGFELWAVCKMLYNAVQNSEKHRENCR